MKKFLLFLVVCVISACAQAPVTHTFGAAGGTSSPIIPASWTVPTWFVDPANVSTTASDFNDCQTITTPCVTFQEIESHRWGTFSPRLQQNTTITVLSSQAAGSQDFLYFNPYQENGSAVIVKGNLGASQQIATGTISATGFVAKVRSTGTLLQANTGATAINQLVVNSTHPSRAWTAISLGAGVFSMSQPIVPITVPGVVLSATSVDAWASGDSVTVFAPPTIHMLQSKPVISNYNAGVTDLGIFFYQLNITPPTNGGVIVVNPLVTFIESSITVTPTFSPLIFEGGARSGAALIQVNDVFTELEGSSNGSFITVAGGIVNTSNFGGSIGLSNDVIVGIGAGAATFAIGGNLAALLGAVYVATGSTLNLTAPFRGDVSTGGSSLVVWGPGALQVTRNARLNYPAGATAGVTSFLQSGGFTINGQTKSCSSLPGSALTTLLCNITVSAANLDATLGATSGCLSSGFGGGSICNFGP